MSLKYVNIILDDNPLLRKPSKDVDLPLSVEDKDILLSMLKYVVDSTDEELKEKYNLKPAVGLAAPQIGINKKMFVIDLADDKGEYTFALANPKIISHSEQLAYMENGEGCLSVEKEHEGYVYRYARIKMKAYDLLQDKEIIIKASGYLAIALQHEFDHINGVLFYDHINNDDPFEIKENSISI